MGTDGSWRCGWGTSALAATIVAASPHRLEVKCVRAGAGGYLGSDGRNKGRTPNVPQK